jgi:hypothetical protein
MPLSGDFSCFKPSKTNATNKQQSEEIPASLANHRQSKTSIVDRFRSFESIFNSCLKSNQSSNENEKRRSTKNKYLYHNNTISNNNNNNMPMSRTNETFSNDDEEPLPTISTASNSSLSSTYLNKQKSSLDLANQQSNIKVEYASNQQKLSDESFRKILSVRFSLFIFLSKYRTNCYYHVNLILERI